jgi:hypothetical protein
MTLTWNPTSTVCTKRVICFSSYIFEEKKIQEKMAEILKKTKKHVNNPDTIHEIAMISVDKSDCLVKMKEEVDKFMKQFVENDNYFVKIPKPIAESVKRQLKTFVEEEYVSQVFVCFYNF